MSDSFEPKTIPRRARRDLCRIEYDQTPIHCRGQKLDEIWWQGRQWAVTAYGLERRDGTYDIQASRLRELEGAGWSWLDQIGRKAWADQDDFCTAWLVALVLHGMAEPEDASRIRDVIARSPPQAAPS